MGDSVPRRIRGELANELVSRSDHPDFDGWRGNIGRCLETILRGEIEKVVMARRTDLTFIDRIDPFWLLEALSRADGSCFQFVFQPTRDSAFVVATPERLFRLGGGKIESEAVSGTVSNDEAVAEGISPDNKLLSSDKNLREHGLVHDYVAEKLGEVCDTVCAEASSGILRLSRVSHLYSRLSGALRAGLSVKDVMDCLHPTPAVCGTPREDALHLIRGLEPFKRGWYAGPVGVIGCNFSEMAVAIRSALVSKNMVSLFAGSGIIRGSVVQQEWEELEHKIAPAIGILGGVLA
jgi:menaquinone-specific isochorismate synthase